MKEKSISHDLRPSDPYSAYNFLVEIDGDGFVVGGFSEVSGITVETEVETIREGGANNIEYKFPKSTKYSDITLKHGITDSDVLWNWYRDVMNGKVRRKNITIFLLGQLGNESLKWGFFDAYPIKWEGPVFNALNGTIAIETLVITHHGFGRIK